MPPTDKTAARGELRGGPIPRLRSSGPPTGSMNHRMASSSTPPFVELFEQITRWLERGQGGRRGATRRRASGLGPGNSRALADLAGDGAGRRARPRRPRADSAADDPRPGRGPAASSATSGSSARSAAAAWGSSTRPSRPRWAAGRPEGPAAGRGPRPAGPPAVPARGPGRRLAAAPADRAGLRRRPGRRRPLLRDAVHRGGQPGRPDRRAARAASSTASGHEPAGQLVRR